MKKLTIYLAICFFFSGLAFANDDSGDVNKGNDLIQDAWKQYSGAKINLMPEGEAYLKLGFIGQAWFQHAWNNPGTVGIDGEYAQSSQTIGMRRSRITAYANFHDKFHVYAQFGVNNTILNTGGSNAPSLFFHDYWMAYTVKKDVFNIGAGLSSWNGVSRLSNRSATNMLLLDYEGFIYPNLGHTDQAARQMGFFAFGNVEGFAYRFALTQPFIYDGSPDDVSVTNTSFEVVNDNLSYKGYVAYNFLDKEYYNLPFYSMNYLGKKRIFNIGAGFDIHPGSVAHYNDNGDLVKTDRKHFGVDIFMELPRPNGGVWNLYTVGYSHDYGPNYLRTAGMMQPSMSVNNPDMSIPQGAGNKQFDFGTGKIWYTNVGYVLPTTLTSDKLLLQPFAAFTYKDFEGLTEASWQYDLGLSYYIYGPYVKLSTMYSHRPVYAGTVGGEGDNQLIDHKGNLIIQLQFCL